MVISAWNTLMPLVRSIGLVGTIVLCARLALGQGGVTALRQHQCSTGLCARQCILMTNPSV